MKYSTYITITSPYIPLPSTDIAILLLIAIRARYTYSLISSLENHPFFQEFQSVGSLYAIVHRLKRTGLIERFTPRPLFSHKHRKYYRLTLLGKLVLKREIERLNSLNQLINQYQTDPNIKILNKKNSH